MESARAVGDGDPRRENESSKRTRTITAVIYVRQSLDKTGEGLGVERQETECRRLAELRGYQVTRVISENSVSATKGVRPGYTELLQIIKQRRTAVVVVYKVDRLLRKLTDLEDLIKLTEETGVQIATVQGDLDLSTSSGRMIGRLLATVARAEVETMSERRRLANAQRAAQGRPYGTGRTYGYEPDGVTIREPEAAVLREMARRVVAGHAYADVAHWANEQGHLPPRGGSWRSINVRNRLMKKKYAGIRDYQGVDYQGTWEPIFDAETWDQLQLTIRLRGKDVPYVPRPRSYLLTGLVFCGRCGGKMIGSVSYDRPGQSPRRSYTCPDGNKHLNRSADALDHFIRELVFYRIETPALGQLLRSDSPQDEYLSHLLQERQAQRQRLDGLVDDYGSGLLDARQLQRAKAKAEERLQDIEQEIQRAAQERSGFATLPLGEAIRQTWEQNDSLRWRQSLLAVLIKKITVRPGMTMPWYDAGDKRYRFDPNLIEIEWRDI